MRLEFLFLGKTKEAYLAAGIDDFLGRLRHYAEPSVRIIKDRAQRKGEPDDLFKEEEGKLLLGHVPKGGCLVALDRTGAQLSSEDLAGLLGRWENEGRRCVAFLIGGSLGLPRSVLDKADQVLSLSKMTFTHDMTRLLLAEQLYRAFSIRAGTGYHK